MPLFNPTPQLSVGTDPIWDAAGDLVVGSGADTAARLAKGAAGGVLAMLNGAVAWNSGSSFPATPAVYDRFFHMTYGMEFYCASTGPSVWYSTQEFGLPLGPNTTLPGWSASGEVAFIGRLPRLIFGGTMLDILVMGISVRIYVATTNNGSAYWTVAFALSDDTAVVSFTTASDSADAHVNHDPAVTALLYGSRSFVKGTLTKTGGPGPLYANAAISYRIVGT